MLESTPVQLAHMPVRQLVQKRDIEKKAVIDNHGDVSADTQSTNYISILTFFENGTLLIKNSTFISTIRRVLYLILQWLTLFLDDSILIKMMFILYILK